MRRMIGGLIVILSGCVTAPQTQPDASESTPAPSPTPPVCFEDLDGDGVPGHRDACPNTPAQYPVGPSGCTLDTDCDGVPNRHDHCLNTPIEQSVNAHGCHDGPGPWPEKPLQWPLLEFASDSATLSADSLTRLDAVAKDLLRYPGFVAIIIGHTDSTHNENYNDRLGFMRAYETRRYLLARGVPSNRLLIESFGESRPRAPNTNEQGKQLNRRVELRPWIPPQDPYLIKHQLRRGSYQLGNGES